jgi:hypothetical protein
MATQVQVLRSNVAGARPADGSQAPGVLYVNWPDKMLGVIGPDGKHIDLLNNTVTPPYVPPTYTAGSVLFAGANGAPTQDNANLFWDDAANVLKIQPNNINTAGEAGKLRLYDGQGSTVGFGVSPNQLNYRGDDHVWFNGSTGVATEGMRFTGSKRLGIRTSNPQGIVHISSGGLAPLIAESSSNAVVMANIVKGASATLQGYTALDVQNELGNVVANNICNLKTDGSAEWVWDVKRPGARNNPRQFGFGITGNGVLVVDATGGPSGGGEWPIVGKVMINGSEDPLLNLHALGTQNNAIAFNRSGTTQAAIYAGVTGEMHYRTVGAQAHVWDTSGIEKMRLHPAGNLCIGTAAINNNASITIEKPANVQGFHIAMKTTGLPNTSGFWQTATDEFFLDFRNPAGVQTVHFESTGKNWLTSGNFGLGETNPAAPLHIVSGNDPLMILQTNNNQNGAVWFRAGGALNTALVCYNTGQFSISNRQPQPVTIDTNGTEKMRVLSNGEVLIGATTGTADTGGYHFAQAGSAGNYFVIKHSTAAVTGNWYQGFTYGTGAIGAITQNGTTGVLYNTTSDYRLKENVQPLADGLDRVNAMRAVSYYWKGDGSFGEGFLAHELQVIFPDAVSGEKDGEQMQSVDYGRITPLLVAAIQQLSAKVAVLEGAN